MMVSNKWRIILLACAVPVLVAGTNHGPDITITDGDFGYAFMDRLWPRDADGTTRVAVCWIDRAVENFPKETALVQAAVAASWERQARIEFYGWLPCAADSNGIRIEVGDRQPKVTAFGRALEEVDDSGVRHRMYLNFTFANWGTACHEPAMRDSCIRSIAVHEFGHAIGFAHEQDRDDTPTECSELSFTGTTGEKLMKIGDYDPESEMNYCNLAADGSLSPGDITTATKLYGART